MLSTMLFLASSFCLFFMPLLVDAGLYVVKPAANSACHAGRKCTIDWLDDGSEPLLPAMGICTFGLYHGNQRLVQSIPAVDVSRTLSVSFVPNAAAGPISDAYYIGIISVSYKDSNNTPSAAFSPFFKIDQMTGSFATPLPAATSTQPIPSSFHRSGKRPTTVLSTITVGTLSTSLPPSASITSTASATPLISSPRITTSTIPSTLTHSSGTGTTNSSASSTSKPLNSASGVRPFPALLAFLLPPALAFFS